MGDGNHSLSLLKKAHYEVILDMVLQNLSSFNSYLNRKLVHVWLKLLPVILSTTVVF